VSTLLRSTRITLEMIKWEHSIFALPFALTGMVLAADGWPGWRVLALIVACMVTARTAAMSFNRLADAELDAANPRTKMRALPAGELTKAFTAGFTLLSAVLFILAAFALNRLAGYLSPVALLVVLGYSYMKRVTRWSHAVLGLALGIAPAAAWIAVRGSLDPRILLLTAIVLLWVGAFDVLYACQDFEHDRNAGLNSVPQAFGLRAAFWIARAAHLCAVGLMVLFGVSFGLGWPAWVGFAVVAGLLAYEHSIIAPNDLRRMNAAFFTLNGIISVVFFMGVACAVWARHGW
jgi:4-hydroxybenzoate polyprenyltransferase